MIFLFPAPEFKLVGGPQSSALPAGAGRNLNQQKSDREGSDKSIHPRGEPIAAIKGARGASLAGNWKDCQGFEWETGRSIQNAELISRGERTRAVKDDGCDSNCCVLIAGARSRVQYGEVAFENAFAQPPTRFHCPGSIPRHHSTIRFSSPTRAAAASAASAAAWTSQNSPPRLRSQLVEPLIAEMGIAITVTM
jgi:hypothetical protein